LCRQPRNDQGFIANGGEAVEDKEKIKWKDRLKQAIDGDIPFTEDGLKSLCQDANDWSTDIVGEFRLRLLALGVDFSHAYGSPKQKEFFEYGVRFSYTIRDGKFTESLEIALAVEKRVLELEVASKEASQRAFTTNKAKRTQSQVWK
jgi:hypothetical protein